MGRIFEYAYLAGSIGLAILLATGYKEYSTGGVITICIAAGICAFMFSFRRKQRKLQEMRDRESAPEEDNHPEPHDN